VVGASGAVFGLFGVFLAYNYRRRSLALYASRARQMLVIIAISLLFSLGDSDGWWQPALGGLVAGVIVGACIDGWEDRISPTASTVLAFVGLSTASAVIIVIRTAQLAEFATWTRS
jgi:membrane associated rhomboid family serine protease